MHNYNSAKQFILFLTKELSLFPDNLTFFELKRAIASGHYQFPSNPVPLLV